MERTQSFLGALVDVYWQDSLHAQLDAEGRYNNTFLALIAFFKAESLRQPVVLFLEDLQFTDEDTRSFLPRLRRSLMAGTVSYPVAVIVSSRPGGEPLANDIIHARIDLRGLSKKAADALTEDVLGGTASPELKKFVAKKSEGNPYFIEQIVRYFQEEDVLEMSKEGWSLIGKPRDTIVPGDISAVLIARLDQLTRAVRETIQTAAVLGREFEVQVLSQMLRNEEWVFDHVAKAEKAAVWQKLTDIRYLFSHGLLRDAAYTMQMRARRHELHTLAMSALETLYADNLRGHYVELAYHAECADIIQKARTYYTLAGKEASELYQNSQAVDYFSRALLFISTTDLVTRYDLVFERAGVYSRIGKRDLQLKDIELLTKWASQLNDRDRIAKAMMSRSAHAYFTGNFLAAINAAKQAQDCSDELADTEQALYTHVVWAVCLLRIGQMDEAMQHAKEALKRDRRVGNKREISRMLSAMGWIALDQNQPTEAHAYLVEALELAREIKDPALEARALNQLALLESSVNGNYALAQTYLDVCRLLAHKVGDRYMESGALGNLGFVMGAQGDLDLARSCHEQSLILVRESEDINQEAFTLVNLSAIHAIQGDVDLALQTARRAVEISKAISERSGQAWAELYMGHAYLLLGDVENARVAYQTSITIREELKQQSLLMEPLAGLVESYLQENNFDAASQIVEQILAFLETGSGLDGTDEPLRIYYACYILLKKKQDPRATQILQTAKKMIEAHLARLQDEIARKRYVENIPWRRAIYKLSG
ncbi:MAG: tetratricopeptide repeat protein [Anaerolineales bacterium]|nr:tetratricopeptide repeat protein [Anaerolineales bacterium]